MRLKKGLSKITQARRGFCDAMRKGSYEPEDSNSIEFFTITNEQWREIRIILRGFNSERYSSRRVMAVWKNWILEEPIGKLMTEIILKFFNSKSTKSSLFDFKSFVSSHKNSHGISPRIKNLSRFIFVLILMPFRDEQFFKKIYNIVRNSDLIPEAPEINRREVINPFEDNTVQIQDSVNISGKEVIVKNKPKTIWNTKFVSAVDECQVEIPDSAVEYLDEVQRRQDNLFLVSESTTLDNFIPHSSFDYDSLVRSGCETPIMFPSLTKVSCAEEFKNIEESKKIAVKGVNLTLFNTLMVNPESRKRKICNGERGQGQTLKHKKVPPSSIKSVVAPEEINFPVQDANMYARATFLNPNIRLVKRPHNSIFRFS